MVAQARLLNLLENLVKSNNCARIDCLVNQTQHHASIVFNISCSVSKPELELVQHQVVLPGYNESILDDLHYDVLVNS